MVLKNPTPQIATNNLNNLPFKQIQTEDYELHRIQQNVQSVMSNVTQALNKQVITVVTQPNPASYNLTTTSQVLIFPNVTTDSTQSYMAITGAYTAPQAGVFEFNISTTLTIVGGATTALISLISSVQSTIVTAAIPAVVGVAYANLSWFVTVANNENINFAVSVPSGTSTATMSADSRAAFTLVV